MKVPHIELYVRPGRDMARLVEVAALTQALKRMGHDPARDFNDRLIAAMSETGGDAKTQIKPDRARGARASETWNDPAMTTQPNPNARPDGRGADQLRPVVFQADIAPHATGSVLVRFGATQVICAATIEPNVPTWMKQQGVKGGWLTAEYSLLPYSTLDRKPRDISKGRLDGRTVEIQRLIGRALRAVIDLGKLGTNTLWIDCDVLQADGGTRTASITGAYLAARWPCRS